MRSSFASTHKRNQLTREMNVMSASDSALFHA